MSNLLERFSSKWIPEPNSGCWLWTAALDDCGYGRIGKDGRNCRASRISWELFRGQIPFGQHVLHKCDTPACVNPNHLFLGTHGDNMKDAYSKGRKRADGEHHPQRKLTIEVVRDIRTSRVKGVELARIYGVSPNIVCHIRKGRVWKNVT